MKRVLLGMMVPGLFLTVFAGTVSATTLLSEDFESGFTNNAGINGIHGWSDLSTSPQAFYSTQTWGDVHVPQLPGSSWIGRNNNNGSWVDATRNLSATPTESIIETSVYFNMNTYNGTTACVYLELAGPVGNQYMDTFNFPNTGTFKFKAAYKNADGVQELPYTEFPVSLATDRWYQMRMRMNTATKALSWDYRGQDGAGGWTVWTNLTTFTATGTMVSPTKLNTGIYMAANGNNSRMLVDNYLVQDRPEGLTFEDAVGHWMFGSDGTRLNDNNPPYTTLGCIWYFTGAESPWGDTSNGFFNDKTGYTHLTGNGGNRLFVSNADATELVFNTSITTWARIKWNGQVGNINRLMGRQDTELGWVLNILQNGSQARFYVSSDGNTTYEEVNANYAFTIGTWYDVSGTFDHTTGQLSVYVYDPYTGQQLASGTRTTSLRNLYTPVSEFRILSQGVDNLYMDIESAAVWNHALTPGEIRTLTNNPPLVLSVAPDSLTVASAAGTTTFAVQNIGTGTGMGWTAAVTDGGSWLSIAPGGTSGTDNTTITLNVTENTDTENTRIGTIQITAAGAAASPKNVTVLQSKKGTTLTLLYEDFEGGFDNDTGINGINGWSDLSTSPQAFITSNTTWPESYIPMLPDSNFIARPRNAGAWVDATRNLSATPTEPTIETSMYFTLNQYNGVTAAIYMELAGPAGNQYMDTFNFPNTGTFKFKAAYKNADGVQELPYTEFPVSLATDRWYQMRMRMNTATKALSWDYRGQDGAGGWTVWTNLTTFTATGTMVSPTKLNTGIYFADTGNRNRLMVDNFLVLNIPDNPPPPAAAPTFSPEGGAYAVSQNVVISSTTPGAVIRYTTDGRYPSETSTRYTSPIPVNDNLTLKARTWATGYDPSDVSSNIYVITAGPYNRPASIPQGTATVDGNLADWADALWARLDQAYDSVNPPDPPFDINEAWYSAKWSADGSKVYIAVKVFDTDHLFSDNYTLWNARDAVELYIHTTGPGPINYSLTQADAQQYAVGIKNSNRSEVWSVLGDNLLIPTQANFQAAGREDGDWLYYEAAITPFKFFSLSGVGMVPSPLLANQLIGLDVVVVAHDALDYTGSLAENVMTNKYKDYTKLGLHKLVVFTASDLATVLAAMDSKTDEPNWNDAADYDGDGEITSTDLSYVLSNMP